MLCRYQVVLSLRYWPCNRCRQSKMLTDIRQDRSLRCLVDSRLHLVQQKAFCNCMRHFLCIRYIGCNKVLCRKICRCNRGCCQCTR